MVSAVLDTNVLISGIIRRKGMPGRIVDSAIIGKFDLVTSAALIKEFRRVVREPEIAKKYRDIRKERVRIEHFLKWHSVGNPPHLNPVVVTAHPHDDRVLECALTGRADYIVSGDRHLLELANFEKKPIVTPNQFLDILAREA